MNAKPAGERRTLPIRLCCGERHAGALCNDNSVMCCLCFNKYPLAAMSETADSRKTDVCPNCATIEALMLWRKDAEQLLHAWVDESRADYRSIAVRTRTFLVGHEAGREQP